MIRRVLAVAAGAFLLATAASAASLTARLPAIGFEDQDGRALHLSSLRGRVVVIVYGGRAGLEHHVGWGKRLDADLRARGVYRLEDPPEGRPVRILALAQMGGIPEAFRPMLRAVLRQHVEKGFSLWLDWDDRMGALFGTPEPLSTVVVAGRDGLVHLVAVGLPEGAPWQSVAEALRRLI